MSADAPLQPADLFRLRSVVDRYAVAVDSRDRATLVGLFTLDATLVRPASAAPRGERTEVDGSEAIADLILTSLAHLELTRHEVLQQVVEPATDGDRARAETYCTAHHIYAKGDGFRDNALRIRYRDSFERVDGNWRIARRRLLVDWSEDHPVRVVSRRPAPTAHR